MLGGKISSIHWMRRMRESSFFSCNVYVVLFLSFIHSSFLSFIHPFIGKTLNPECIDALFQALCRDPKRCLSSGSSVEW